MTNPARALEIWANTVKDPDFRWPSPFPYDVLAPFGLTPESSAQQILDASFDLMASHALTPAVRAAWDAVRNPENRLLLDLFFYHVDFESELHSAIRVAVEALGYAMRPRITDLGDPAPVNPAEDLHVIDAEPLSIECPRLSTCAPVEPTPLDMEFDR